ncbi:MAG TPA: glycosyltransferase family 2 protein [bacterium]|nr:glycosyltransferase family 2 protein [bacterium]HOL66104.1 glycosyltransferase family 2 protein [bacterium]
MEPEIAVVLPAHNEARTIGQLVSRLKETFHLVVVVDDGSRDDTGKLAARAGAVVIRHQTCQGKGAALKTGFQQVIKAGVKAVLTMDADGQHSVEETRLFLTAWRERPEVDLWLGRRNLRASRMPFLRRLTNRLMSLMISLLAGQFIPDTQNGFRLIKREVIEIVKLVTNHFETESELLLKAAWQGFRIASVPVATLYGQEKSKIQPLRDTGRFFLMLFRLLTARN